MTHNANMASDCKTHDNMTHNANSQPDTKLTDLKLTANIANRVNP